MQQKEPDRACSVASEALEIHAARPVDLIIRRTGELVREMRSHKAVPSVRDFRERRADLSRRRHDLSRSGTDYK
jgi:hypothetical protein